MRFICINNEPPGRFKAFCDFWFLNQFTKIAWEFMNSLKIGFSRKEYENYQNLTVISILRIGFIWRTISISFLIDFSSFWSDGIALCRNEYINPSKSLTEWRSAGPNPQEFKCIRNFLAFWREVRIFSFVRVVFESKTIEISLKNSQNFSLKILSWIIIIK